MEDSINQLDQANVMQPLNEIKVVFLGDGEAGKTHTIARLLNDGGEPLGYTREATPGVNISSKEYDLGDRRIRVKFWDFGGQEILHSLHRMFLTERTLYVVMVNARDDTQDDQARYWLSMVKYYAKNAPVVLVLNKMDRNPNANVYERELAGQFSNLRRIVKLSSLIYDRNRFNQELTNVLLEEIRESGFLDTSAPASWLRVRNALESMDDYYIHFNTFRNICESNHVDIDCMLILRWMTKQGVVFYCGNSAELAGYVVLNPNWIMNAAFMLLNNRIEGNRNGMVPVEYIRWMLSAPIVTRSTIRRFLADVDYSHIDAEYVLGVLRRFHISFRLDEKMEFFPMLCRRDAAEICVDYATDTETLEFQLEYDYLPDAVLYCLMAEMNRDLDVDNSWRTGARFVQKDTSLSAVVKTEGDVLRIFVRTAGSSHQPQMYLNEIRQTLHDIHRIMELQEPEAKVVYKEGGVREEFSYDMLMAMLEHGQTQVFSMSRKRPIRIEDILIQTDYQMEVSRKKLLTDIAEACSQLQTSTLFGKQTERFCNDVLRECLNKKGYDMLHQGLAEAGGLGNTIRAGAADLMIMNKNRQPWTTIEAMNVRSGAASVKYWDQHLTKLLNQYNPHSLSMLFLICYVDCAEKHYENLYDRYREHIRWYDPDRCKLRKDSFQEISPLDDENPFLRAARCTYDCGGVTVTVYHYFVRVGDSDSETENMNQDKYERVDSKTVLLKHRSGDTDIALENPQEQPANHSENTVLTEPDHAQNTIQDPSFDTNDAVLREYRVVFLGDSEAGKSLILSRLKEPEMDPATFSGDTTPGIDIASRIYTIGAERVRVNYWDFGGQEILHSMHRMFLAQNTLYVIVLNTRNDNQEAQAVFWLRYVQSYAPGAPVLLVMNKIDQNLGASLNMPLLCRQLNRDFDERDVLKISAIEKNPKIFHAEFTDKLMECIAGAICPTSCFNARELRIRDALYAEKSDSQIIKEDHFRDICDQMGVTDEEQQDALMVRFHEAGILVFFGEGMQMLLNPEWITKAIYKVLEKRDELSQNGIVVHKKLRTLYRRDPSKIYESDHAAYVLEVMRGFGLSFQYGETVANGQQTEGREFIPMLCQRQEPREIETIILEEHTVELQMRFEYLPSGVLHQLMVERKNELDMDLVWLSGAVFRKTPDCYAVVRRESNVMYCYVHACNQVTAVGYLRTLSDRIKELAEDLKYRATLQEVKIGFQVAPGVMEYFDYDRLMGAKICKLEYVASKIKQIPIAVQDVLDQEDRSKERDLNRLLQLTMDGCMKLQKDQTFWWRKKLSKDTEARLPQMDENARNRELQGFLERGFIVRDQTQGGESGGGGSPGELDLEICIEKGRPWSILEALNISEEKGSSRTRWIEHLQRMANKYNKSGLRYLILVSYLLGPAEQFGLSRDAYLALLKNTSLMDFNGLPTLCETVHLAECPERIHISRADYSGGAGKVSIFHFLVHIPEYVGKLDVDKLSSQS